MVVDQKKKRRAYLRVAVQLTALVAFAGAVALSEGMHVDWFSFSFGFGVSMAFMSWALVIDP